MSEMIEQLRQALDEAERDVEAHGRRSSAKWVQRLIERDRALLAQFEEAEAFYASELFAAAGELTGLRFALDQAAAFWLGTSEQEGSAPNG